MISGVKSGNAREIYDEMKRKSTFYARYAKIKYESHHGIATYPQSAIPALYRTPSCSS